METKMICRNCGHKGIPRRATPGSILIELILWICFIVPGLIYSIWRLTSKRSVCPRCEALYMIPLDSPIARKMIKAKP